jgi:SAM-dependent methyltransferase
MQCRVMDAEALDLPDGELDAAACRLGLMLMADPKRAVGEALRVLRPGGRLAVVVWGASAENPWATAWWSVLETRLDLPETAPGAPGMFALADPARLSGVLESAGFAKVRVEPIPMRWEYTSFDHAWEVQSSLNSGLRNLIPDQSPAELEQLRADIQRAIAAYGTAGGGYSFPAAALGAVGSVPAPDGR